MEIKERALLTFGVFVSLENDKIKIMVNWAKYIPIQMNIQQKT